MAAMKTPTKKSKPQHPVAFAACSFALSAGGEVQLLPAGQFRATDGRPLDAPHWLVDATIAQKLSAHIAGLSNPVVIDYEHQTLLSAENGQPAPAAGWFKSVRWVEGEGLFAVVDWTERATAHIKAGEYKFISPVITYDRATGAITKIINAALTNHAAIDGMAEVSARLSAQFTQEEALKMDMEDLLEDLRWLLNLPTLSTPEDVAAELQKAISLIKQDAGTPDGTAAARFDGLVTALTAQATQTTALKAATDELAQLKADKLKDDVDHAVMAALATNKIFPAEKEALTELGMSNLALLTKMLAARVPSKLFEEAAPADLTATESLTDGVVIPKGYSVDPAQSELYSQVVAFQNKHGIGSIQEAALKFKPV